MTGLTTVTTTVPTIPMDPVVVPAQAVTLVIPVRPTVIAGPVASAAWLRRTPILPVVTGVAMPVNVKETLMMIRTRTDRMQQHSRWILGEAHSLTPVQIVDPCNGDF